MSELIELKESEFDTLALQETRPVIIDFWSPSCGPCRLLTPVFASLAKSNEGKAVFLKCNVVENMSLAAKLNVSVLPTILVIKNGSEVSRLTGVQKQAKLQELVDAYL